jgi:hypothetical protein
MLAEGARNRGSRSARDDKPMLVFKTGSLGYSRAI